MEQEPVVSVRNIPKSQYESSYATPTKGGAFMNNLKSNWHMWALGIGVLTIVVMIYLSRRNQFSSDSSSGSENDPNKLWGSQLDADYQQLISEINQLIALERERDKSKDKDDHKDGKKKKPPKDKKKPKYYTVKKGDTISNIAYRTGFSNWQKLYNAFDNAQNIQKVAREHGHNSNFWDWIYPGERIRIA